LAGKALTVGLAIGGGAAMLGARPFLKPQGFVPTRDPEKNTLTAAGFKNASPVKRNLTMLSLSLHRGSPRNVMGKYWGMRAKDIAASTFNPFSLGGAAVGGTAGGAAGLLLGVMTKRAGKMALGGAILGAVAGGHSARKVQLQVARGVNEARRNAYKKNLYGNPAKGGGPGYRLWANSRTMGKPGHLGMDGTLPFAMHKARHRSTIR